MERRKRLSFIQLLSVRIRGDGYFFRKILLLRIPVRKGYKPSHRGNTI